MNLIRLHLQQLLEDNFEDFFPKTVVNEEESRKRSRTSDADIEESVVKKSSRTAGVEAAAAVVTITYAERVSVILSS